MRLIICALVASAVRLSAPCETSVLDFIPWQAGDELPNGWRQVGLQKYTANPFGGAAYFNGEGDKVVSPAFARPILSVAVTGAARQETTRVVSLVPFVDGRPGAPMPLGQPPVGSFAEQRLDLTGLGATQFELVAGKGMRNWAVSRIAVVFGEEDPPPPEEQAGLSCWNLAEFLPRPGVRALDLSGLGKVSVRRAWENGVDGDGLCLFADADTSAGMVRPLTDKSVNGGLYCFNAGTDAAPTNALALLGSSGTGVRIVLPLRLDAELRIASLGVDYVVREVKRGTASGTVLSFAWTVGDDLFDLDGMTRTWIESPTVAVTAAPAHRHEELPVGRLCRTGYLCLRWSVPRQANSSAVGLLSVRVAGTVRKAGFALMVR